MKEIWKPIKDYEDFYEVSNFGRIKALSKTVNKGKCHRSWKEHYLKYGLDNSGYYRTNLSKDGTNKTIKVHRIVAQTFIDNPENKPTVNHINGIKTDNRVENLEWCTQNENMQHACDNKLKRNNGEHNTQHKLTYDDICYIRSVYKARDPKYGAIPLSRKFGVHRKTISRITLLQYWKEGDADVKRKTI